MTNLPTIKELSPDQMHLIKNVVAKNATDDELNLFLYRCREIGLDPLKPGQIFFIKYGSGPGTIVIGRDGFRAKAAATGLHSGTRVGVLRDDKGKCIGAWAEIYRSDWQQPAREEVSLHEYNSGKGQWAKMPETMIKKVAEVAALRMAFPDQLSGLYSDDEMAQATPAHPPANAVRLPIKTLNDVSIEHNKEIQQSIREDMESADKSKSDKTNVPRLGFRVPAGFEAVDFDMELDILDPGFYVAKVGKPNGPILGKKIKDINPDDLMGFMSWLRGADKLHKPSAEYLLDPKTIEFIQNAEEYINERRAKENT